MRSGVGVVVSLCDSNSRLHAKNKVETIKERAARNREQKKRRKREGEGRETPKGRDEVTANPNVQVVFLALSEISNTSGFHSSESDHRAVTLEPYPVSPWPAP